MTAVKGSKQYRVKVVRDRPLLTWLRALAGVVIFAAFIVGGYRYGLQRGLLEQAATEEELASLRTQLAEAREAREALRQQLANLELGAEVDREASEKVRREVIDLKNQLAELEEENSFYRNLMAPSENQKGLNFGAVELVDTDAARHYRYKVVMQQLATNHQLLNGTLTFNVVGRQDGTVAVFPLRDLSEDVDSVNIKLRFKYFQTVEGVLQLPEGFEPERIELIARSTGRDATKVEKRFGWLVQET